MTRSLLLILAIVCFQVSFGQVTITSDNVPVPGSSYYMAVDGDPAMVDPGVPGENQQWDFRGLGEDYVDTLDFVLPSSTPYGNWFPFTDLAVYETDTSIGFLQTGSARFALVGAVAESQFIQDTVKVTFDPEDIMMVFPTTYQTQFDTSYMIEFSAPFDQFPFVDSIRYRSYIDKIQVADAWGTLTTNLGSYGALRLNITRDYTDTLWVRLFGNWMVQETDAYTRKTFEWWTNETSVQGYPLAILKFNADLTNLYETQFMKGVPVSVPELPVPGQVAVYPNPAADHVTITGKGIDHIRVFDMNGRILLDHALQDQDACRVNVDQWPAGVYFYSVSREGALSSGKIIIRNSN